MELLPAFNQRPFKRQLGSSRHSMFAESEQSALQPLPLHAYEHADWRFKVRVRIDYLVENDNHHYSVSSRLVQQQVDVRATDLVLEVFHTTETSFSYKAFPNPSENPQLMERFQAADKRK